jgi:hypothetical protein
MKIDWRQISACNYCSNYNSKDSSCKEQNKELTIYEELQGCEKIAFTGGLKLEFFKEIPEDSILRKLSIEQLSKSNPTIGNLITSKNYGDYFNKSKSIEGNLNLAKSEEPCKIISMKKTEEAEKEFEWKKAEKRFFHQSDHLVEASIRDNIIKNDKSF